MKIRLLASLVTLLLTVILFSIMFTYAFSESSYVYVDQEKGSDLNNGSIDSPFATINKAIEHYNRQEINTNSNFAGKIILCSDYVLLNPSDFNETQHRNTHIEISSIDSSVLYIAPNTNYYLGGPTTFKNINISVKGKVNFVANFNSITFDTGVKVLFENASSKINVFGGYKEYLNEVLQ